MSMLPLILKSLLIFITFSSYFLTQAVPLSPCSNSTKFSIKIQKLAEPSAKALIGSKKLESFEGSQVILRGNTTITSENTTFKLGFFAPNNEFKWYLGIWYASIPIPTYVWVANRERPINNLLSASAEITEDGKLAVMDQDSRTIMWETNNVEKASGLSLSEQGNLVLLSSDGRIVWQSFDFPTDTWLPGMNLTAGQRLTSWKSSIDPTPGRYYLRLNPPDYGEIALFYSNDSVGMNILYTYWTTGNWSGNAFSGVPEMTIPYIYRFDFIDPFTPMATFGYTEVPLESGIKPPLTRFVLDHMGRLKQFTWSQQSEIWNMFWSQPENVCRVYGLCGNLGLCNGEPLSPCQCLNGFSPVDGVSWGKDDFSEGCWREGDEHCGENDKFEEVGAVSYERTTVVSFSGSRSVLTDSSSVAVKRLERPGGGEKEFRAEVCTIGNIQHVNLNLSWDVRFRVAVGTARGIAYLHEECRNCIIHCDIKPENILLGEDFSAKAAVGRGGPTFGPWRRRAKQRRSGFFPPWAARQIIDGHVAAVVDERLGGLYNEAEAARLGLVAVWCIQDDESTRPTMGMVVKMLEGVVEVTVPPPPKLLQALVSGESFRGVGVESGKSVRQEDAGSFDDNVSISVVYNPGNRPDVNALLLL
ncbi:hypothetical protein DH2020_002133 [Rehmannia glutinosa]|uniref:Bulb-type lectin domain-containing protein n=1 Tax=Rehmannia glutinosa TaxID=99300 RepID=A0ABR0XSW4_REHGL